jgi:catechol 2,3-dioxygenase-like lactoylglutathione lyase family enzyme
LRLFFLKEKFYSLVRLNCKFGVLIIFSHITVGTNNLSKSGKFYNSILIPLGYIKREVTPDGGPKSCCWASKEVQLPRFPSLSINKEVATSGNGSMVSFLAPDITSVNTSYAAAFKFGGIDEGEPNNRENYGTGYYGAYIRDPDGNKIHIVYRGDI